MLLLGTAGVTEGDMSSCMSPLLSRTLEREKSQRVTNCVPLVNQRETTREGDRSVIHHCRMSPRVCWPAEHLTAVFDDVLVAVWVLDSVLSRPGSFNLGKIKCTKLKGLMTG